MSQATVIQLIQQGLAHHQAGRFAEATATYHQVLAVDPGQWDAMHLLGLIAHQQGRHVEGVDWIAKALKLRPREAGFWFNYGNVLAAAGRDADAVNAFRTAVDIQPSFTQAWFNLCNVLEKLKKPDEVAVAAEAVTQLRPENADDHFRLGHALSFVGHLGKAASALQTSLRLRPGFLPAQQRLAQMLLGLGRNDESITLLREIIAVRPPGSTCDIHDNLLLAVQYSDRISPREIFEEHLRWARMYADPLTQITDRKPNSRNRSQGRIRVGYVSADFRAHPVGRFILAILSHHDPERFEIFCYASTDLEDEITESIKSATTHWTVIFGQSDDAVAEMIRKDQIDLLIDLGGHTGGNRLPVFARKPAPVAATYLGYPGTTGMSAIDFRITDALADPPGVAELLHREKLVRLPNCFLCYEPPADTPDVAALPAETVGHVTFGSFNQSGKMSPATLRLWADVLKAVPKSRMVLKANGLMDPQTRERLFDEFKTLGIDRGRVEMLPVEAQHRDHLAKYARIDIALDTFPYHGTTTTCDALWMGVPTLTLAGEAHVSRVGVSLLTNAGLPEWIAESAESFTAKAALFAGNIESLKNLRRALRERLRASPLMDAVGFVRDLEDAYGAMIANVTV